ncbi:MAG: hypothetical protein U0529_19455 [Thermoanaerobaculia bacterium]
MRRALPVLALVLGAEGPLAAQSVDDFPPLTRTFAAAAIRKEIGCAVDVLVLSVEPDEPAERPDSRTVTFRLPGSETADLRTRFEWEWRLPEAMDEEWNEPPGTWKVASSASPVRPPDDEETRKLRRAVEELRTIAVAVEAFAVDHEVYPPSGAGFWKRLVPTYIRRFPTKDPWGNAWRYETGPVRDHYVLASAGSEAFSRLPESYFHGLAMSGVDPFAAGVLAGPSELVFSDGVFLLRPFPELEEGTAFLPDLRPCGPPGPGAAAGKDPGEM